MRLNYFYFHTQMNKTLYIITSLLILSACERPDFELVPKIEFLNLEHQLIKNTNAISGTVFDDVVTITIYFEDGDGDLGLDLNGEDNNLIKEDQRNYWLSTYRKEQGVYQYAHTDSSTFNRLINNSKNTPINGQIKFSLLLEGKGDVLYVFKGDTVHFELYITDRSGNKSNTITTPDFIAFEEE